MKLNHKARRYLLSRLAGTNVAHSAFRASAMMTSRQRRRVVQRIRARGRRQVRIARART